MSSHTATPIKALDAGQEELIPTLNEVFDVINRQALISFNHWELQAFRSHCPNVNIGATMTGIPIDLAEFGTKAHAQAIILNTVFTNKKIIRNAHKLGLKVYVFTVNEAEDVKHFKELKVDGVISDFPQMALDTVAKINRKEKIEENVSKHKRSR